MKNRALLFSWIILLLFIFGVPSLGAQEKSAGWYGDNLAKLQKTIGYYQGKDPSTGKPVVAVFDFDNTCIGGAKGGDFGDIFTFYMVKHNLIRKPSQNNWKAMIPYLSRAGADALSQACTQTRGNFLVTEETSPQGQACAKEILTIYDSGKTTQGADAFAKPDSKTFKNTYAFTVSLQRGYTPQEIRNLAKKAMEEALTKPLGATQTIGGIAGLNAAIRSYPEVVALLKELKENGWKVIILTASSQPIVEVFAESQLGIPRSQVIGVQAVVDKKTGKLGATFVGCGPYADGNSEMMTFNYGKRCHYKKLVEKETIPDRQLYWPAETIRLAAADSPTDLAFVLDAASSGNSQYAAAFVINRNKEELMCHAYNNKRILVQPMFYGRKAQNKQGYQCGQYGLANVADRVY